jgi:hypothetical protein
LKTRSFGLKVVSYAATSLLTVAGTLFATDTLHVGPAVHRKPEAKTDVAPSVAAFIAMTDTELAKVDPIVMNLTVAKGIPECSGLDIGKYIATVDSWARAIDDGSRRLEPSAKDEPLYKYDRDLWRAGGMAIALAGPAFGVKYTGDKLDPSKPEQSFVYGLIDRRVGTCASMPVLYMAIGHRLGWPIHGVVSKDHMWARWDDGIPADKGGKRFNLEATTATSDGLMGEFASTTDEEYAKDLGTPQIAVRSGSDMTSLTPRETLGVYLQSRAAYWQHHGDWQRCEADLLIAVACFPKNRDIRIGLVQAMGHTESVYFTQQEVDGLAAMLAGASEGLRSPVAGRTPHLPTVDVDRINRENVRRLGQTLAPLGPPEGLGAP